MPENTSLLGFVVAALIVLLIPGPGVLYIIARSLSQGLTAGLVSVLGLATGALVHIAAATLGLSAILLTSEMAFGVVKILGAGYLIYLGVQTLLTRHQQADVDVDTPRPVFRLFTDGVLISVLNPKIALFFLAFLPQFVRPDQPPVAHQVLFLGVLYVLLALVTDGGYAVLAGALRRCVRSRAINGPLPRYASGAVYIGLGVSTALTERP